MAIATNDMQLIDSHSHLDVDAFDGDRADVIARACAVGVTRQVIPAIAASGWKQLRAVCAQYVGLHAAYGLHPLLIAEHRSDDLAQLHTWIERECPIAVGECGLDHFVEGLDPALQRDYFDAQLAIARDFKLPLIVHARRAVDEVIGMLRAHRKAGGDAGGVVHSFAGSPQQAQLLWDIGWHIGIGGPVTYERAARLRKLVATMPIEFLLLETDSPDQPNSSERGERNEPSRMRDVLHVVAQLRNQNEESVASATTANAERLFRLPSLN